MMLSDKRIVEELEKGNIVIDPFDERYLGTNSYDVRLGEYYYIQSPLLRNFNLGNPTDISLFWDGPYESPASIPVPVGQTILAHTIEIIGGKCGITTKMYARSTIGRCGLSICRCAGLGDVGYINRWTLEISNHTKSTAWIPVGWRIAQICFFEIGETIKAYQGKYGQGEWKPEDMLPRPSSVF